MPLPFILMFSFILGIVATYAEPSILTLRGAAGYIRPWSAPLLFLLLPYLLLPLLLLLALLLFLLLFPL